MHQALPDRRGWEGDYEGDLVIRASVPYDVLQLELGENERLAWRHVLDWIQRMGHRKFGHVCYPETAGGGPVIDFQRLFAPCNDEERNLDRHFQVGDGQELFLRSGTVPIPVRGPRNGAARRRARFEPEQHHGARRERRPSPAHFVGGFGLFPGGLSPIPGSRILHLVRIGIQFDATSIHLFVVVSPLGRVYTDDPGKRGAKNV